MKKGEELRVRFTDLTKLNTASAVPIDEEGKELESDVKIKVKNGVPGKTGTIRISKKRKGRVEGKLLNVDVDTTRQEMPICYTEQRCGGCSFLSIAGEEERVLKENYLRDLFEGYPFEGLIESPLETGYRNKMEYSFGDEKKNGPLTLGMHQRGSFYNVVNTPGCILAPKDFERIRETILEYFQEKETDYYHKNHQGFLRHLVLRKGYKSDEILVNLVTSSQEELNKQEFVDRLLAIDGLDGKITGIIHTLNDNLADAVIPDTVEVLYGKPIINENLLGLDFQITPFSFFQVNTYGAEKLYSVVREMVEKVLDRPTAIYDLYSGTGTITLLLADLAEEVIGIELSEEATAIAIENAKKNNIENATFIAGDVLDEAGKLESKADIIILDPPREGIRPKALTKILALDPKAYVYVSCNPESLKRDLPFFEAHGYTVKEMKAVNMFPMTSHVETVALLEKANEDKSRVEMALLSESD